MNTYVEGEDTYDNNNDELKYARIRGAIAQASYNCKDTHKNVECTCHREVE